MATPARRLRLVVACAVLAPLLLLPAGAGARSALVACEGTKKVGPWQVLPVSPFRGVEGVATRDVVTGYAVDPQRPERVLATNGNTVKTSGSYGCVWDDGLVLEATPDGDVELSGTSSTVVATALLPGGPALAAVREGSGPASRPHVAVSDEGGRRGSWRLSDAGLPAQGAPRLLRAASDGRTAYLTIDAVNDGGTAGGTLPGLPDVPGGAPLGGLYATTDGGRSWSQRAGAADLPAGGITGLAIDVRDPDLVYAVADARLLLSTDGGRSFRDGGFPFVRAVETLEPSEVAVAIDEDPSTGVPQEDGILMHSTDAGRTFAGRGSVLGLRSLSYRRGDDLLLAEAGGRLYRIDARRDGRPVPLPAPGPVAAGSTMADRTGTASYTALSEHALLRWVDPATGSPPPPVLPPDLAPPPPPPGRVAPPSQSVSVPVGETRLLDYTLVLPPSPTPLDLVFLIDTSPNMGPYIDDLRRNLRRISDALVAAGVDVKVGLATAGPGPGDGEPPYPEANPAVPGYRKPALYRLLREVGPVDARLQQALDGLRTDSAPQNAGNRDVLEGQLVSLRELVAGEGVKEEASTDAAPRYAVKPGQPAGFRRQLGIRRMVIHATDEPFNNPYGTPRKADGSPDLEGVGALLKSARVQQAGISPSENGRASLPDLRRMAELTGALAPQGGIDCTNGVVLRAGDPLVCQAVEGFSDVITDLVRDLADRQDVQVSPVEPTPVLGSVDLAALTGVDVTRRNDLPLRVRVSCVDVQPGTYVQQYRATLRGFPVADLAARVTCTPAPPVVLVPPVPPEVVQEPAAAPAGQPPAQAPAAPVPAPPVVQPQAQPQAQVQSQVQVQPLTAGALQQQQELQLALALLGDERTAPSTELAMVDRRRGEQVRAVALLATSLAVASAFGLARLRARPALHRTQRARDD